MNLIDDRNLKNKAELMQWHKKVELVGAELGQAQPSWS